MGRGVFKIYDELESRVEDMMNPTGLACQGIGQPDSPNGGGLHV